MLGRNARALLQGPAIIFHMWLMADGCGLQLSLKNSWGAPPSLQALLGCTTQPASTPGVHHQACKRSWVHHQACKQSCKQSCKRCMYCPASKRSSKQLAPRAHKCCDSFCFCSVQAQEAAIGALVEGAPMSAAGQAVVSALEVRWHQSLACNPRLGCTGSMSALPISALSVSACSVCPCSCLAYLV